MTLTSSSERFPEAPQPKKTSSGPLVEAPSDSKAHLHKQLDAGNGPSDHYRAKLSPLRFRLRSTFLPFIRWETPLLVALQLTLRHPALDLYFAWTANLASHTFYVLMLPIPVWLGAGKLHRDLVYVLGLGIFISGHLKDFLCLPRPRSPPLHRITMSLYTAQEYGFPLSHSANATAVTLVFWHHVQNSDQIEHKLMWFGVLALYYVSLIFGRIYCGMHGFFDVITGAIIGVSLFVLRAFWGDLIDSIVLTLFGWFTPIVVFGGYVFLIHIHLEPVDDCPCFDDSVAFIGVLIGLDVLEWYMLRSTYGLYVIPFHFARLGIFKTMARLFVGIAIVATWKAISKPVIFTILPPIYKVVGVYLPRRNFEPTAFLLQSTRHIRSQSISNMNLQEHAGDLIKMSPDPTVEVGPESDIDRYEMLDYERSNFNSCGIPNLTKTIVSGVFRPRYDVEIVGRIFVYAGVATVATWGFRFATELLELA